MNFREFEHAGWEKLTQGYHDAFGHLTTQTIEPLLDAVAAKRGAKILDVASGPGYVAAVAAARGAAVTGLDFSAAMVADASRRYPSIEFREGDAEELPFADGSFDAVTMNFGLLHVSRPERALAEARRVLRQHGRFAFTVWAKPEEARALAIVLGAIQKHGDMNVPLPPGPPFFRFSDAAETRRALNAAGFGDIEISTVPLVWRLPSPEALWDFIWNGTVRTGALLRAQKPQALEAIRREIVAGSQRELPMPAVLASATKEGS